MELKWCLICQEETSWSKIFELPDYARTNIYTIYECGRCRVKRTLPVPENLAALYSKSEFSKPQQRFYHFLKGVLIRWEIKRICSKISADKFLDLGCGYGDFAENLSRLGYSVIASDDSRQRPCYIQHLSGVPFLRFDFEQLKLENPREIKGRVVILRHVLEHARDPGKFLKTFMDLGASYFYIVVPNAVCLERRLLGRYNGFWHPPYHLWHFNKISLKILLEKCGIEVVKSGFDTIPTIGIHMDYISKTQDWPGWLRKLVLNPILTNFLYLPFNLFFSNNVVWVIGKTKNK